MKHLLQTFLLLSMVLLTVSCQEDFSDLPCEIADEHFNNAGSILAEIEEDNFLGESVYTTNEDGTIDFYISRFSLNQCYTSDLIILPSISMMVGDTTYLQSNLAVDYEIKSSRDTIIGDKRINPNSISWLLVKEINMEETELRGEFYLEFIDDDSPDSSITGEVIIDNGQFFSVLRE